MANSPPIISLEEYTESINMCIYGDSGIGKTVFAGTAPNALFLAIERGTVSAARQGSKADLWQINHWNDLETALDWLQDNPNAYEWVIIDSTTEMQKLCMRGILDNAVEENNKRDRDIPALQDWQKYYNLFDRFVAAFNSLPVNILYTALTIRVDNEDSEELVLPDIQGRGYHNAQTFCASMDVVAYYRKTMDGKGEDAESKRSMLFESSPPYFAKDRYGVFPRWVAITQGDEWKTTMADIASRLSEPPAKQASKPSSKKTPSRRKPPTK